MVRLQNTLQGKYHYMNIGLTSMQGIPTTVSVSSAFLQKCMNDPKKQSIWRKT